MKNRMFFLKKFILLLFIFSANYSFSQFNTIPIYYGGGNDGFSQFVYNNQYYDRNPRGLKKFLEEAEMTDDLRKDLSAQLKKIYKKKAVSFSGEVVALTGFVLFGSNVVSGSSESKSSEEKKLTNVGRAGLVMFLSGIAVKFITSPRKKDYLKFVNTFNSKEKEKPIIISLKVDYDRQTNFGLAMTF